MLSVPQRFSSESATCLLTDQTNEHTMATAERKLCHQCNLPVRTPLKQVKHCEWAVRRHPSLLSYTHTHTLRKAASANPLNRFTLLLFQPEIAFGTQNALSSTSDQFAELKPLNYKYRWLGVNFTGEGIRRSLHTIKQHNYCFSIQNILANWDRLTSVWQNVKEQALQYLAWVWECCKNFLTLLLFSTTCWNWLAHLAQCFVFFVLFFKYRLLALNVCPSRRLFGKQKSSM